MKLKSNYLFICAAGAPVISLLQQVNHKLRLPGIFNRSASAKEPHHSSPAGAQEGRHSLEGGPLPVSQLPLADSSIGLPTQPCHANSTASSC